MASAAVLDSQPEIARPLGRERSRAVTTTDVLKFLGVAVLLLDHYGLYFDPDQAWWRVFGRLAPPIFFFLIGFARTRSVPWTWLAFGAVLTALEVWTSWEGGVGKASLNILLNFALLRFAVLPGVERLAPGRWIALAFFAIGCVLLIDLSDRLVEYGTAGWLWAVLGLSVRLAREAPTPGRRRVCIALALTAAGAYGVRESIYHELSAGQTAVLAAMIALLTPSLLVFRRLALPVQPPAPLALLLRFCGRYSLELYAVSLFAMQLVGHATGLDGGPDDGKMDSGGEDVE